MADIQVGDRVHLHVSDCADRITGTVQEISTDGTGALCARIDIGRNFYGKPDYAWRRLDTLDNTIIVKCKHEGCYAVTKAGPRSQYWCPDHLSEIFDSPADVPQTPC